MATPVDAARNATNISTAATSHAINVGSPVAGERLIVVVRFAAAPGTVTFTGYTTRSGFPDTSDASDDSIYVFYRTADGSEGATDTLTTTNSVKLAAICWRITGADNSLVPDLSSSINTFTAANSANPDVCNITGGPKDSLYLGIWCEDGEGVTVTTPGGWSNAVSANSGTGGAVATNCVVTGFSLAEAASSSQDIGFLTHTAPATGGSSFILALSAAASPGPVHKLRKLHRFLTMR